MRVHLQQPFTTGRSRWFEVRQLHCVCVCVCVCVWGHKSGAGCLRAVSRWCSSPRSGPVGDYLRLVSCIRGLIAQTYGITKQRNICSRCHLAECTHRHLNLLSPCDTAGPRSCQLGSFVNIFRALYYTRSPIHMQRIPVIKWVSPACDGDIFVWWRCQTRSQQFWGECRWFRW